MCSQCQHVVYNLSARIELQSQDSQKWVTMCWCIIMFLLAETTTSHHYHQSMNAVTDAHYMLCADHRYA
jgi:hypothetical protein